MKDLTTLTQIMCVALDQIRELTTSTPKEGQKQPTEMSLRELTTEIRNKLFMRHEVVPGSGAYRYLNMYGKFLCEIHRTCGKKWQVHNRCPKESSEHLVDYKRFKTPEEAHECVLKHMEALNYLYIGE